MFNGFEKKQDLIDTTWKIMHTLGFPESLHLLKVDNIVYEYERPNFCGMYTMSCESLIFLLETPYNDDVEDYEKCYVSLDFEKDMTSFIEINFMFPDIEWMLETCGSLGLLEIQNSFVTHIQILPQAIKILKGRSEFKKYRDELKRKYDEVLQINFARK